MRESAQLAEGVANLTFCGRQAHGSRLIGARERNLNMERDTDQALLRTVVQVTFDAPSLTVGRGDNASLGRLNVG
jgi:hypothetical protein